jgi:hypothetical protein
LRQKFPFLGKFHFLRFLGIRIGKKNSHFCEKNSHFWEFFIFGMKTGRYDRHKARNMGVSGEMGERKMVYSPHPT